MPRSSILAALLEGTAVSSLFALSATETILWLTLAMISFAGLLALLSPARFRSLSTKSNTWVDSNKALAGLDKKVDLDELIMPHTRWLGAVVLAAVGVIGYFLSAYQH